MKSEGLKHLDIGICCQGLWDAIFSNRLAYSILQSKSELVCSHKIYAPHWTFTTAACAGL